MPLSWGKSLRIPGQFLVRITSSHEHVSNPPNSYYAVALIMKKPKLPRSVLAAKCSEIYALRRAGAQNTAQLPILYVHDIGGTKRGIFGRAGRKSPSHLAILGYYRYRYHGKRMLTHTHAEFSVRYGQSKSILFWPRYSTQSADV